MLTNMMKNDRNLQQYHESPNPPVTWNFWVLSFSVFICISLHYKLWNHRIIDWLGLEGTSGIIKFQLQYTSRTICDFPTIFQRYSLLWEMVNFHIHKAAAMRQPNLCLAKALRRRAVAVWEWRTLSFTQTPQGQQGRVHTRGVGHGTE